jgi:hypothetical protein
VAKPTVRRDNPVGASGRFSPQSWASATPIGSIPALAAIPSCIRFATTGRPSCGLIRNLQRRLLPLEVGPPDR